MFYSRHVFISALTTSHVTILSVHEINRQLSFLFMETTLDKRFGGSWPQTRESGVTVIKTEITFNNVCSSTPKVSSNGHFQTP